MQRSDEIVIKKILREIDDSLSLNRVRNMSMDMFLNDADAQHAVAMAAINVGELVKHVSEDLRNSNKEIPWKQAAGLRDVTAHAYDTIKMDNLYQTIVEDFPVLKEKNNDD